MATSSSTPSTSPANASATTIAPQQQNANTTTI